MKVSKEFIQAMNGVLNGEKWRRPNDEGYIYIEKDNFGETLLIVVEEGRFDAILNKDDMTATDWVKVD